MDSHEKTEKLLSDLDLTQIEKVHAQGLTSAQIIQIFQARGVKLSEATFRKYVQLGLLPRCKRVGTKGKHRGSHGVYPCATVRRINTVKQLMASNFTIEDIQRQFGGNKSQLEQFETGLEELLVGFEREMAQPQFDQSRRRLLVREMSTARRQAGDLFRQLSVIEAQLSEGSSLMHVQAT